MTYKEYEEEGEVVGTSNIKLILKKKLKDKLDCLSNYEKTEVGGFLTYEKIEQDKDGEVSIILDDILIPPQEATSGDVDVDGVGQIELRKEYGDKCLKIIGHFHSHRSMGCFFSSTDESMMKSYSENKNFRVFIVGSKGEHLIRLVLRNSINEIPFEMKIENVECEVEADDTIRKEMEDEIKRKVKEPEVKTTTTTTYTNSNDETKKLRKEIALRVKYYQHQNHKVKVEKIYKCYANLISEEFKVLNPTIEKAEEPEHFNVIVELGNKNKAKEFMCDVKEYLLKTILDEKEKSETEKEHCKLVKVKVDGDGEIIEEDSELAQYLDELDDEEFDAMERAGCYMGESRRCDWRNFRDKHSDESIRAEMRKDFSRHNYIDYSSSY